MRHITVAPDGKILSDIQRPDVSTPVDTVAALDALAVDAEKASTVAALRDVVKKVIDLERARP